MPRKISLKKEPTPKTQIEESVMEEAPIETKKREVKPTTEIIDYQEKELTPKKKENISSTEETPQNENFDLQTESAENTTESFETENQDKMQEIDNALETTQNMEQMLSLVLEMKTQIRRMKRLKGTKMSKTDLIALVSTLEYAIKTDASEYFYGLVLSIKYIVISMRNLRILAEKLEDVSNKLIRS